MSDTKKGIKQRYQEANYLDVGTSGSESYALMNTGFSKLDDSPSAQTGSRRWIGDKSASKSIKGYDWSAPFELYLIESEEAVKYIVEVGRKEKTGDEAETSYVVVDLTGTKVTNGYPARRRRVAIEVSAIEDDEGELKGSGNLLGIGDWEEGYFDTTEKTFSAESGEA